MSNRRVFAIVFCLIAMTLSQPAAAIEGNGLDGRRRPPAAAPNAAVHAPPIVVASPPGPYRAPAYDGCCPWYGYGFGVPTYQWGYCGSTYRPVSDNLPLRLLQHLHAMGLSRAGIFNRRPGIPVWLSSAAANRCSVEKGDRHRRRRPFFQARGLLRRRSQSPFSCLAGKGRQECLPS